MEQLSLDLGITNIDDAMTDRQTSRRRWQRKSNRLEKQSFWRQI